ncbi:hypothetical protein JCM8097_001637 [Rhodosporidiobolus ruineniae]
MDFDRPSRSLNDLPPELLKLVAGHVRVFDEHVGEQGINRAKSGNGGRDVLGGCWSYWLGRGILALSMSVTPRQLHRPFFRFDIERSHLREHITEVAFVRKYTFSTLCAAAAAFPSLPNLRSLRFDSYDDPPFFTMRHTPPYRGLRTAGQDEDSEQDWIASAEGALKAYRDLVPQIRQMHLLLVAASAAEDLLELFYRSGGSLDRLSYGMDQRIASDDMTLLGKARPRFLQVLRQLNLGHLELSFEDEDGVIDQTWDDLRLPTLRSFSITVTERPGAVLEWVSRVAPTLERLDLVYQPYDPEEGEEPYNIGPPPVLSPASLRHFSLKTAVKPAITKFFLSALQKTSLVSFALLDTTSSTLPLAFSKDFFPPNFDLPLSSAASASRMPPSSLPPTSTPFETDSASATLLRYADAAEYGEVPEDAAEGMWRLLGWATRQAQWAVETGDVAAFGVLSEALRRVKDLQRFEHV